MNPNLLSPEQLVTVAAIQLSNLHVSPANGPDPQPSTSAARTPPPQLSPARPSTSGRPTYRNAGGRVAEQQQQRRRLLTRQKRTQKRSDVLQRMVSCLDPSHLFFGLIFRAFSLVLLPLILPCPATDEIRTMRTRIFFSRVLHREPNAYECFIEAFESLRPHPSTFVFDKAHNNLIG